MSRKAKMKPVHFFSFLFSPEAYISQTSNLPIFLDYVGCDGTELNILDCDHYGNIGDYYSYCYDAKVNCQCKL